MRLLSLTLTFALPVFAQELGDANMKEANRAASTVVKQRMEQERPADAKLLQDVSTSDIVVVRGEYDRVEDVLKTLGIRHTVVSPIQVATLELNAKQLLIVDCPGDIGPKGIERIRKFVNAGGYLYTTDWALTNVVQKAFPGFIAKGGRETGNDVVAVQVKQSDDNLLKHLTLSKEDPKWWLESSSYAIRVLQPDKVDVLITSKEMKKRYGQDAIAVHFRYGDGQVLHIVSHFYLQQNQSRSVADKKKSSAFIDDDSSLSAATKASLKGKVNDGVNAGDLNSAYAAQQMTSNIVVERKRDQGRIDSLYDKKLKTMSTPSKGFSAGAPVKAVETRGDQVKVRNMSGDEAWVPASAL